MLLLLRPQPCKFFYHLKRVQQKASEVGSQDLADSPSFLQLYHRHHLSYQSMFSLLHVQLDNLHNSLTPTWDMEPSYPFLRGYVVPLLDGEHHTDELSVKF
jgi:hypothetical protein